MHPSSLLFVLLTFVWTLDALKTFLPQDKLLKSLKFYGIDADLSQTLIDKAEQSIREWDLCASCFLTPPQQKAVTESFKDIVDLSFVFHGGYPSAENRRVLFRRSTGDAAEESYETITGESSADANSSSDGVNLDEVVALINVEGNFLFEKITFADVRSALTQTLGSDQGQVGDVILNGDRGAQVLIMPEHCETICSSLKQILSVPVDVSRRELTELKVRAQSVKELSTVEASLRLDAIASAGFGYSRTKMASLVDGGMVQVDWKDVKNAALALQIGQEVSVRGVGRLVIEDAQQTNKGRFKVKMKKYT